MQVEEELVAPACCSGVGLGGKGNEDRDRFLTKRGAEEGLPEEGLMIWRVTLRCVGMSWVLVFCWEGAAWLCPR